MTRAIELWLLFPLGTVVSRLLTRSGKIPESWRHRLDLLLGTPDWYDQIQWPVNVWMGVSVESMDYLSRHR
jgi:hypothetical protein